MGPDDGAGVVYNLAPFGKSAVTASPQTGLETK